MLSDQPTVFVVDDDAAVRRALARLLECHGFQVESFAAAADFLDGYLYERPGCLILDVQLPGLDGFELQSRLAEANCHLPVVFITGHGDIPMSVRAMKGGAVDFMAKPFEEEALLAAVAAALLRDRVARGERRETARLRDCHGQLTPREQEVFSQIVVGLLNKEVAERLQISEKTVKVHRARVMAKMQVDSLAELVRVADKLGM